MVFRLSSNTQLVLKFHVAPKLNICNKILPSLTPHYQIKFSLHKIPSTLNIRVLIYRKAPVHLPSSDYNSVQLPTYLSSSLPNPLPSCRRTSGHCLSKIEVATFFCPLFKIYYSLFQSSCNNIFFNYY